MKKTNAKIEHIDCVYHQMMPYHTMNQARMFFASAKDLGVEAEQAKERAKKKFEKDCFNKLTKDEMKWLLDSMKRKIYDKGRKENKSVGQSQSRA